jgi:hypothetical protein
MMAPLVRSLAVWLLIVLVEVLQGTVRTVLLKPRIGDLRARQVGVLTGSAANLAVAVATVRWIDASDHRHLLGIGLLWLVLTLVFEVAFGWLVARKSWGRIASDYDLRHGGLLPLGMAALALSPVAAARLRRAGG